MKFNIRGMYHGAVNSVKEMSPQILTGVGITGLLISGIIAVFATKDKLPDIQMEHEVELDKIREKDADEDSKKKESKKEKGHYVLKLVEIYAPSVVLAGASIGCILKGNDILQKRNVALAAAYATIDNAYQEYRKRVIVKYGEDADKELRFGGEQRKIEVVETDETGKEKKVKKTAMVTGPDLSGYARYFAYGESTAAEPNIDYNEMFLKGMQKTYNQMLKLKGVVFLNEVYESLGYKRTEAGQSVGWIYDRENDDHGDNYIDFRIEEVYRECPDRPGTFDKVIIIDPNVDGNVMDHAKSKGLIEE